jgi:hypothetical protein
VTTPRTTAVTLLVVAALASAPGLARGASLAHRLTIYLDDKEEPLRAPEGIACNDGGALVVADTGGARLLVYTYRDGKLTGGAPVKLAEATYPVQVQVDGKGNVVVLDGRTRRLVRVDTAGKYAGVVALKGASGLATVVPSAFKLDATGSLYVLDVAGSRVLVAGADGRVTRELPLPKGKEQFTDVAVDGNGRILAVDAAASRVWAAEKGATSFKAIGEPMKDRVSFPVALADHGGRLYLVDQHGHGIAVLGGDGSFQGRELEMGWVDGKVYYPAQICLTGDGQVFVADRNNNRVQIFSEGR